MRRLIGYILLIAGLTACAPSDITGKTTEVQLPAGSIEASSTPDISPSPTATSTPLPAALWVSMSIPDSLRTAAVSWNVPLVDQPDAAALHLDQAGAPGTVGGSALWIYSLVAPFPTILDGITGDELRQAWSGVQPAFFAGKPLMMTESTQMALTFLWGEPAGKAVQIVPADQLLELAWAEYPSWAIVPFESLQPEWKVLAIDGQSPLQKDFDPSGYPLSAVFTLECSDPCPLLSRPSLPSANRDPAKMTTVVMTGVTALVRAIAYVMENKEITYPGRLIGDWLRQADIAHVSNEIPFDPGCPYPNRGETKLIFCSDPRYIALLEDVGVDVVELTGNHFEDRGPGPTLYTLEMYNERGIPYFGGGANVEDARKPLLMKHNGNKLAFIGCNPVGPDFAWATDVRPGAAKCDHTYMTDQIRSLNQQGYQVISTFQYYEYYSPEPRPWQQVDFRRMADAGAVIVSGSQAHSAQAMEFYNGSFIHYGLGNLFFDQMRYVRADGALLEKEVRNEFLDRHVFYDGKYIGTELLTAILDDYSIPRPMEATERFDFLKFIFEASSWSFVSSSPTLTPTVTPTPLVIGTPTYTPAP